jgi:diacylglycerol kinase (ATP)
MSSFVILNPHAANGATRPTWERLRPLMEQHFGALTVKVTERVEDVEPALREAHTSGASHVFSFGGDGTNHSIVNELVRLQTEHPSKPHMIYASIPVGTGRDWIRSIGMPLEPEAAVGWLAKASTRQIDVGELTVDDNPPEAFLNVSSIGLGGWVAEQVNIQAQRRPWTFMAQSVRSIFAYHPQAVTVEIEGDMWFDGETHIAVVGNGGMFGHGMHIVPNAVIDDGLLDVVMVEGVGRIDLLWLLGQVYTGRHMNHSKVTATRARRITITCSDGCVPIEMDGESLEGRRLAFRVLPAALTILS